ncbi:uncharacterized protein BDV17DRAFT_156535 [Aspergillus undulatus]|uniref:uncharacterized protein n=1 Tax=Aspergillus undulatus TaxID=1810928 RepID=UPI003CCE2AEF
MRINYQGQSYLSRISNSPFTTNESSDQQILKVPLGVRRIVLSADSIGVRQVQFVEQGTKANPDGSPRYEVVNVSSITEELYMRHNNLFIKSLAAGEAHPSQPNVTWNDPNPPHLQPWNFYGIQGSYGSALRLEYMTLVF